MSTICKGRPNFHGGVVGNTHVSVKVLDWDVTEFNSCIHCVRHRRCHGFRVGVRVVRLCHVIPLDLFGKGLVTGFGAVGG